MHPLRRIQRKKALLAWFTFIPNDISAGPGAFGNEKRVAAWVVPFVNGAK